MTWWPDGDAPFSQEIACPACGRTITVRTSTPVSFEWDRRYDGGRIGYAIHATEATLTEFHYVVVGYDNGGWTDDGPGEKVLGETAFGIHECDQGGEAGDRVPAPSDPPQRSSAISRHEATPPVP